MSNIASSIHSKTCWSFTGPFSNRCKFHHLETGLLQLSVQQKVNLQKLQVAQNTVSHVISVTSLYEHIRQVLSSLHWLPVQKIKFKVAVMTFKIHQSGKLAYIASLINDRVVTRSLCSSCKCFLEIQRRSTEKAKHSFSFAALSIPMLFTNSIPLLLI